MEGKIAIRDGKVYFASGFYLSTIEGVHTTNFFRLECSPESVTEGEFAWSPSIHTVKVRRGMGIRAEWRICSADGLRSSSGDFSPGAALSEDTCIPRPKVRAGTDIRWSHRGWAKYSKRERNWIPA